MPSLPSLPSLFAAILIFLSQTNTTVLRAQTYRSSVYPVWSNTHDFFWYEVATGPNSKEFVRVDPAEKRRQPAFDHQRLADAFTSQLRRKISPDNLPIAGITYLQEGEIRLKGHTGTWLLKTADYSIAKIDDKLEIPWNRSTPGPSRRSSEPQSFELKNELNTTVFLDWITSSGGKERFGSLRPNESKNYNSFVGHSWSISTDQDKTLGGFRVPDYAGVLTLTSENIRAIKSPEDAPRKRFRTGGRLFQRESETSPDERLELSVRDDNLWLTSNLSNESNQITTDATRKNSFRRDASRARLVNMQYTLKDFPSDDGQIYWAPDSSGFVAIQATRVTERRVSYTRALPGDSTTPRMESYPYAKPGDVLPHYRPRLFSSDGTEIPLSEDLFPNPFDLSVKGWSEDGTKCYLLYNERGHQTIRYLEVNAVTGEVRTIIEERSDTFIQYSDSGKFVLKHLGQDQILWASERTGWNHLYLYSANDPSNVVPVTKGEWNVRRIDEINTKEGVIWFYAVGVHSDQDPYHLHFCRVNLDGSGFRVLTDGDGTHEVKHSPDGKWLIDRYSRVDMPTVTELRRADDGQLVTGLEKASAAEIIDSTGPLPIRFQAPGRDGTTPIWGLIHLPKNFDPERRYPVVENIYAGPHDHHVPKAFRSRYVHQKQIADAGFVVVQIDGMGTAWRSKAFHDVCFQNLRDAGFPDRIAWIKAAAAKYPWMDVSRVGIYGGSAGGQNAMAALLWHNDFYSVAVADCGCHDNRVDKLWWNEQWMGWPVGPEYAESSNVENAHLLKGNLMLSVGECDRNVDPASTTQVVARLVKANKNFDFLLLPGQGHGACESPYGRRRRLEFLSEHLKATQEP